MELSLIHLGFVENVDFVYIFVFDFFLNKYLNIKVILTIFERFY